MYTLTIKLKQHTPLIHFQHEQSGATLRASEVKPKLDHFLIDKIGGIDKVKEDWLVDKGDHPALDYKMRIEAEGKHDIKMTTYKNKKDKWETKAFPSIMSNMGGKDTIEELVNFSMYNEISLTITCFKDNSLCELIKVNLPLFFARHNFGQRSSKGFGSFTVSQIGNEKVDAQLPFKDILCMDYKVENSDNPYEIQKIVMGIIEKFWKECKKCIKNDGKVTANKKTATTTIQQYIKRMKEVENSKDSRMPSPILFKPVKIGDIYRIYIIADTAMLKRIANESQDKMNIDIVDKTDVSYIDEKIIGFDDKPGSLRINYDTGEWETTICENDKKKKVIVEF